VTRTLTSLGVLASLAALVAVAQTPSAGPATPPGGTWDDYRIIVTRNIFARDRSASRPRPPSFRPPPARDAEEEITLTGVVVQEDLCVAFFEDTRTGETILVPAGRTFGTGTVVSVSLDGVEYRSGETTRMLSLGENLRGMTVRAPPPGASSQPASMPSSAPATGPSQPGAGTSDILERMRQRRLQELRP
jgi:hypothetical protein